MIQNCRFALVVCTVLLSGQVLGQSARIAEWVENSVQSDNTKIALGYPVPAPVDTSLPFDGFRTYAGLQARHQDLAESTPWVHGTAMGTTLGGEIIWAYRLGDENRVTRRGTPEHAMLTNGGIHAREWQTPETVTGIMELLATGDDDHFLYSYLRDNANVIVIPVLNIDGFKQTQRFPDRNWMGTDINDPEFSPRDGRMRRKNMLMADENLLTQDDHLNGVDLNRNNAPYWSTNPNRSSPNLKSIVHHGAGPQSERETMALDAAAHLGPIEKLSMYTDVHSFSQVHFWVRNSNDRLARQTESLLRTFSNHHARFEARKFYGFNSANSTPRNQGIGATDEYFTFTYQVPSWTLEIEPTGNGGGTDYGGLGRNGHDGFILPESQIRRVRTELAKSFAIAYYRQSGPPSVTAFRLVDKKTGSTVYESEWDYSGPETRSRYEFQTQAVQLDREYTAWIAFDKPMRWMDESGAAVVLPGQPPISLDIQRDVLVGDMTLTSTFTNHRWLSELSEPNFAYQHYIHDAFAIDLVHPLNANNQSVVTGTEKASFQISASDMTSQRIDADPSTVVRWELGAWSGYEDSEGLDHTDTGGADNTMQYEITPDNLGDPFVIEAGISSNWRDPDRRGEGFVLEILKRDRALMYWLTYDDFGQQDWYIAVGKIIGNRIEFAELLSVSGGEFGPGFDPSKVRETVVGSANFIWSDCSTGAMEWELHREGVYRHGRMNLKRLSRLMGIDCGRALLPPVREEAKLMGSWRDITHRGEGYTLELLIDGRAVVYWFTYDTNGNRRWFLGEGRLEDGEFVFPEMISTRGAKFGEAFDPKDVELFIWGSLVMDLDCDGGTATFEPVEEGFPAGVLNVTRLTAIKGLDC